jgi:hypothetical protein
MKNATVVSAASATDFGMPASGGLGPAIPLEDGTEAAADTPTAEPTSAASRSPEDADPAADENQARSLSD